METIKSILGILLLLSVVNCVLGADFSQKQIALINTKALQIIESYETSINEIGKTTPIDINTATSNAESLIELFVNRKVLVYNDLDPSHTLSEFYEVETYASNLILWYPDGIEVILDYPNAKTTPIRQHDETIFSMDIAIDKRIKGNYLNKQSNTNKESLIFRIAFSMSGKSFADFQVAGVRNASSETKVDDLKTLQEVNAEELSQEELNKVYSGVRGVLNDYTNFLALLGDPQEVEDDKEFYRESFANIFKDKEVKVFNDVELKPKSTLIGIPEYLELYKTNFPDGIKNISLNVDSAEFGTVSKDDQGGLFTYIYVDKFFSAVVNQKELFKTSDNLMFKVNFTKSGNSYTSYNIESVDKTGFSYFDSEAEVGDPSMAIAPVSRQGFSVFGTLSYGVTSINDENISSINMSENLHEWQIENGYGYVIGGGVNYCFNDAIGISTGIELQTISTQYSLKGNFKDNEYSYDNSGNDGINHFYMIIDANYDSIVNVSNVNLPILLKYSLGKPGSFGFSIDAGLKVSYMVSAKYTLSGNYATSGHYPDYFTSIYPDGIVQSDPKLGFVQKYNIDETDNVDLKKLNVSGFAKASFIVPVNYYASFEFGPEIYYGLGDISNGSNYIDIFGKESVRKPVNINFIGVNVKYVYKL